MAKRKRQPLRESTTQDAEAKKAQLEAFNEWRKEETEKSMQRRREGSEPIYKPFQGAPDPYALVPKPSRRRNRANRRQQREQEQTRTGNEENTRAGVAVNTTAEQPKPGKTKPVKTKPKLEVQEKDAVETAPKEASSPDKTVEDSAVQTQDRPKTNIERCREGIRKWARENPEQRQRVVDAFTRARAKYENRGRRQEPLHADTGTQGRQTNALPNARDNSGALQQALQTAPAAPHEQVNVPPESPESLDSPLPISSRPSDDEESDAPLIDIPASEEDSPSSPSEPPPESPISVEADDTKALAISSVASSEVHDHDSLDGSPDLLETLEERLLPMGDEAPGAMPTATFEISDDILSGQTVQAQSPHLSHTIEPFPQQLIDGDIQDAQTAEVYGGPSTQDLSTWIDSSQAEQVLNTSPAPAEADEIAFEVPQENANVTSQEEYVDHTPEESDHIMRSDARDAEVERLQQPGPELQQPVQQQSEEHQQPGPESQQPAQQPIEELEQPVQQPIEEPQWPGTELQQPVTGPQQPVTALVPSAMVTQQLAPVDPVMKAYDPITAPSPSGLWKVGDVESPTNKYYGVRKGRIPGIYLIWTGEHGAEIQVEGFQTASHQRFASPKAVEGFMNHVPEDCSYRVCMAECSEEVEQKRQQASAPERATTAPQQSVTAPQRATAAPQKLTSTPQQESAARQQPASVKPSRQPYNPITTPLPSGIWAVGAGITMLEKKCYGVRKGKKPGVYLTWSGPHGAQVQVSGFQGAQHQSFKTIKEAEVYMNHLPETCSYGCKTVCGEEVKQKQRAAVATAPPVEPYSQPVDLVASGDDFVAFGAISDDDIHVKYTVESVAQKHDLCTEQTEVLRLVAEGFNVFFTGAAGTGKSTVLKAIIEYLRHLKKPQYTDATGGRRPWLGDEVVKDSHEVESLKVDVVAYTGIAAVALGGTTIHQYAGWNDKTGDLVPIEDMEKAARGKNVRRRLAATDVLIIDEISMVENFRLSRLDRIMRTARNDDKTAFGGAQLIMAGDFHQLPPVKPFQGCFECGLPMEKSKRYLNAYDCKKHGAFHDVDKWAFCSTAWKAAGLKFVELLQVHRQQDPVFAELLNKYRVGTELLPEEEMMLVDHEDDVDPETATNIYSHRDDVDHTNSGRLAQLPDPEKVYKSVDGCLWRRELHPELAGRFSRTVSEDDGSPFHCFAKDRHRFEHELKLKKGMPVILLANLTPKMGLVNGSRGVIIDFTAINDNELPEAFKGPNDEYVLSPPGTLLRGPTREHQAREIATFAEKAEDRFWPVVAFDRGPTFTVYPHCSVSELGAKKPYSLISRTQLPLAAGWAITVHKSQGMTLDKAIVDVNRAWEAGQSYVAMSRVRTLRGLRVMGLTGERGSRADHTVLEFMRKTFGSQKADEEVSGLKAIDVGTSVHAEADSVLETSTTVKRKWDEDSGEGGRIPKASKPTRDE